MNFTDKTEANESAEIAAEFATCRFCKATGRVVEATGRKFYCKRYKFQQVGTLFTPSKEQCEKTPVQT